MKTVLCLGTSRLYAEGAASILEKSSKGALRAIASIPCDCAAASRGADLVLIDLPASRGMDLVRALKAANPQIQVIALVDPAHEDDVLGYAQAGVAGYFTHDHAPTQLVSTLLDGGPFAANPIASILLREIAHTPAHELRTASPCLTRRELQVLNLIAQGCSNKEIARTLNVGLPTVKNHVHQILSKTGVRRRSQAAHMLQAPLDSARI